MERTAALCHRTDPIEARARLLIVDDDELVLSSLRTLFELETDYHIYVERSPSKAIELLSTVPVDVVISDFLMPEMDGVSFLGVVARLRPEVTRALLTGQGDSRRVTKAVRELDVHYMEKPWDNDAMLSFVRRAVGQRKPEGSAQPKVSCGTKP